MNLSDEHFISLIKKIGYGFKRDNTLKLLEVINGVDKYNLKILPPEYIEIVRQNFPRVYNDFPKLRSIIKDELEKEKKTFYCLRYQHYHEQFVPRWNLPRMKNLSKRIRSIQLFLEALEKGTLKELSKVYISRAFITLKSILQQPLKVISVRYKVEARVFSYEAGVK